MRNFSWSLLLGLFSVFLISGCDDDDDESEDSGPGTLTAEVSGNSQFSILVDALTRTGLDSTLDQPGTFTVFAPTDAAFNDLFAELGVGDLDGLIADVGAERATQILLYHVLQVEVPSSDVTTGFVKTSGANGRGNPMDVYLEADGGVKLNNSRATVQQADIDATNGVAHAIDSVLLPLTVNDIVEISEDLSDLESAVGLATGDLDVVLGDRSAEYTLFAPTNAAFDTLIANLPNVTDLASLVNSLGEAQVEDILLYHTLGSEVQSDSINPGAQTTLNPNNQTIFLNVTNGGLPIIDGSQQTADAEVVFTDLTAENGVVHKIDNALLP